MNMGPTGQATNFGAVKAPTPVEIEAFLATAVLDEMVVATFRASPPHHQANVMARGELTSARNPSATLLARIRDARTHTGGPPVPATGSGGFQVPASADVEMFISKSGIDDEAAAALRRCSPNVQQAVVARGDVGTARNPSATILGRIKAATTGSPMGITGAGDAGSPVLPGMGCDPMSYGAVAYSQHLVTQPLAGVKRSHPAVELPLVRWITIPAASQVVLAGLPDHGPAINYDMNQSIFCIAASLLTDLVGDITDEVCIDHDPTWQQFPEIGAALQAVDGEQGCFAIATCMTHMKWAVGVHPTKDGREISAMLALGVTLAQISGRIDELKVRYAGFGLMLDAGMAASQEPMMKRMQDGEPGYFQT